MKPEHEYPEDYANRFHAWEEEEDAAYAHNDRMEREGVRQLQQTLDGDRSAGMGDWEIND
jgi:hypothetical protein